MAEKKSSGRLKKTADKIGTDQAKGSAASVLEELFNDFNRNRKDIYVINFVRGVFFGFGSLVGGTVVIALVVSILSLFADTWLGPLVQKIVDTVQQSGK